MIVAMPTALFGKITRRQLMTTEVATSSPFTGTQQIQDWGGEWWEYDLDFALHQGREGKKMSAFFSQIGKGRHSFLFSDWSIDQIVAGNPVVYGASQTGNALATSGWLTSRMALEMGDFFQLGSDDQTRLYQMTADAVSDASGRATLQFVPALRGAPASGSSLIVNRPQVLLRASAGVPSSIRSGSLYSFTLSAREAL